MAKENFENILRQLKGESVSDLGTKLRNVIQKAKNALEEKEMICLYFNNDFLEELINEEGIAPPGVKARSLTMDIWMHFAKRFGPKYANGIRGKYIFFDNTPISEDTKKDIAMYDELESNVEGYVNSCNGNPDPKEFKELVYSLLPEEFRNNPEDGMLRNPKVFVYSEMKSKFKVEEYKSTEQLRKDIKSELDKL